LRRSSVLTITAVSCLLCISTAIRLNSHSSSALAAPAQTTPVAAVSQGPQLKPASATAPATIKSADLKQPTPTPGSTTELYTAKRGETIPTVARQYLHRTAYLTSSELSDAIRAVNGKSNANILKAGEQITIPGILPAPIVEHTIPVAKDFEVRAIYLTGIMAASDHGIRIIRHWREVGGNAVVFDIKDSDGSVTIPFDHPLLGKHQVYIHDLPKFVHFVHQQNMHAIARIAIFRDEHLVVEHPELAVHSKKNHAPWRENGKLVWTDPSNPKVQDYDIALAKFVATSGADEIQFDYVRFPAEGDQKDAAFVFESDKSASTQPEIVQPENQPCKLDQAASPNPSPVGATDNSPALQRRVVDKKGTKSRRACPEQTKCAGGDGTKSAGKTACAAKAAPRGPQRSDVITSFLKKAYAELHPTGVLLSLDVFGVMAWQRQVDLSHTGQDIVGMAKYCDVLSPMIYPSHFFGMDNIEHPGDAPEHFIGESMARFELITHPDGNKSSGVVIRPWLQAFRWRTKTYSPEYIKVQVATAKEKGGIGFLFWNAANDYSKPYEAMPEMKAANLKSTSAKEASSKDASAKDGSAKDGSAKDGSKEPKYFRGDELPGVTVRAALTPTN
jgi:hypothetical protein